MPTTTKIAPTNPKVIQIGDSTHSQGQPITPVSFKAMKSNDRSPVKPMLQFGFSMCLVVYSANVFARGVFGSGFGKRAQQILFLFGFQPLSDLFCGMPGPPRSVYGEYYHVDPFFYIVRSPFNLNQLKLNVRRQGLGPGTGSESFFAPFDVFVYVFYKVHWFASVRNSSSE